MTKASQFNGAARPLFPDAGSGAQAANASTYRPLPSIWHGGDAELLEKMLCFYPKKEPDDILDATVNRGRFWRGSRRKIVGMDIDPAHKPDIVADNCAMPCHDASFDVIVYDPPHIPNQGTDGTKDFQKRFGLVVKSPAEKGYNLTHTFRPFLQEAWRVLRKMALSFAKSRTTCMATATNGHTSKW